MECMGYDTVVVGVCTKTPISFLIFGTGCYACQKNTHLHKYAAFFLASQAFNLDRHMSFRSSTSWYFPLSAGYGYPTSKRE